MQKMNRKEIYQQLDSIDASSVADSKLSKRLAAMKRKRKQGGFTLLELLVVIAILAAIAGTATIALQDTDARASAAAHVAMMDQLNKGIRTYRVLKRNAYPNNFDSMLGIAGGAHPYTVTAGDAVAASFPIGSINHPDPVVAIEDMGTVPLTAPAVGILADIGMTDMQYLNYGAEFDHNGDGATNDCAAAQINETIQDRANTVVGGNIFMTPVGNGCGVSVPTTAGDQVLVWTGGYERVMGAAGVAHDVAGVPVIADPGAAVTAAGLDTPVLMMVGTGPSSTLFDASELGGMTTVPIYRHVSQIQYQRYAALFHIGNFTGLLADYVATDQVNLVAIIDGAGDTKEEELGEWDGTRNTI